MDAVNLKIQAVLAKPDKALLSRMPALDGKTLPEAGKNSAAIPAAVEIPEVSVEEAVRQIQDYMTQSQRDLQFRVDEASGRTVISVYSGSGELIRQYPSAEVLKIAAALQEQGFNLIDQRA